MSRTGLSRQENTASGREAASNTMDAGLQVLGVPRGGRARDARDGHARARAHRHLAPQPRCTVEGQSKVSKSILESQCCYVLCETKN